MKRFKELTRTWSAEFCALLGAIAGAIVPWWSFLLIPAAFFTLHRSRFACFSAALMLVHTGAVLRLCPSANQLETVLNGRGEAGTFTVELTDRRLCPVSGVDPLLSVRGTLLEMNGKVLSGKVRLFFPGPAPLRCGDVVRGTGILTVPDKKFDLWTMQIDSFTVTGHRKSFSSMICRCRDLLLGSLLSGINDDTGRNLAAAFFFGATSGLNRERKKDFIASGTIHLFAVSGLHVGLAAAIILGALCWMPFRMRYLTAAGVVGFYVLLTGANIPAMRAGMMIGLFLIFRAFLLRELPLRLLMAAAAVLIIADPAGCREAGFQFSFLITAALLALSARLREEREVFQKDLQLMPDSAAARNEAKRNHRAFTLAALFCSCITAFLAGSAVSLCHFGTAAPVALAVNPLILPGLGVLFALLPLKLLFCGIPAVNAFFASALEIGFDLLRAIAGIAAELPEYWNFPEITPMESAGAAILLLLFLQLKSRKPAAFCGIALVLFALSVPLRTIGGKSEILICSGDASEAAAVLFIDPSSRSAAVINPGIHSLETLRKELRRYGIVRLGAIGFSRPTVRTASGIPELLREFPAEQVILPERRRGDWRFLEVLENHIRAGSSSSRELSREKWKIFAENEDFRIEYFDNGCMLKWSIAVRSLPEGRRVIFQRGTKSPETALLPWSSQYGAINYEW